MSSASSSLTISQSKEAGALLLSFSQCSAAQLTPPSQLVGTNSSLCLSPPPFWTPSLHFYVTKVDPGSKVTSSMAEVVRFWSNFPKKRGNITANAPAPFKAVVVQRIPAWCKVIYMKEITKPAGKNLQAANKDHKSPGADYRSGGSFSEQPGGARRGIPPALAGKGEVCISVS